MEAHQRDHLDGRVIKAIQPNAAQHLVFGDLATVKTVAGGFIYFSIIETIQDAFQRRVLAIHSMLVPLWDLASQDLALVPPQDQDAFRTLIVPSEVHSRRALADIREAIEKAVLPVDLPTKVVTADWTARELNYLLEKPYTSISAGRGGKSPEAAVGEFLAKVPPFVSASISFALKCVPQGSFNLAVFPEGIEPSTDRGITSFPSIEGFEAAVAATSPEKVLENGEDALKLVVLAQCCTGNTQLEILLAFREGLRQGVPNSTVTVDLLVKALQARDQRTVQRAFEGLEENLPFVTSLPEQDKQRLLASPSILEERGYRIRSAVEPTAPQEEPEQSVEPTAPQDEPEQSTRIDLEVSLPPRKGWDDIGNAAEVLQVLRNLIEDDLSTSAQTVVSAVKRFVELVTTTDSETIGHIELSRMVHEAWEEIQKWVNQGGRSERRMESMVAALKNRDHPTVPSLFDDLMYVTRRAGNQGKNSKTFTLYDQLLESIIANYSPPRRNLFRR